MKRHADDKQSGSGGFHRSSWEYESRATDLMGCAMMLGLLVVAAVVMGLVFRLFLWVAGL